MSTLHSFSRPTLLVNGVVLSWDHHDLRLLVQQALPWEKHSWSLPFTTVKDNGLDSAMEGMVKACTQTEKLYFQQVCTQVQDEQSQGNQAIVVSYFALIHWDLAKAKLPERQLVPLEWVSLDDLPPLPESQNEVLNRAFNLLRSQIRYEPLAFELLPPKFSLSQLQGVYEAVLGYPLDKRNFRKKVQTVDLVQELDEYEKNVPYRAAKLFRFDPLRFKRNQPRGFHLKL